MTPSCKANGITQMCNQTIMTVKVLGIMEVRMDRSLITVIMDMVIKEWIQVTMKLVRIPVITKNQPMMSIKVLNSNS